MSTASFKKSFCDIGQALQVPGINKDKADVKSVMKTFLSQESAGRWLLIINNADDIEMLYSRANKSTESSGSPALANYLPFSQIGSILSLSPDSHCLNLCCPILQPIKHFSVYKTIDITLTNKLETILLWL